MREPLEEGTTASPRRAGPPSSNTDPQRRRSTRVLVAPRVAPAHTLARHTVMVVAPNSPQRQRVVAELCARGYEVLTARTWLGALARTTMNRRPIDLVITDPRTPGLGGLPLTQRLRKSQPALPVVLTRLCEIAAAGRDPAWPPYLYDDDCMQPLLEEVQALLSL